MARNCVPRMLIPVFRNVVHMSMTRFVGVVCVQPVMIRRVMFVFMSVSVNLKPCIQNGI